MSLPPSAREAQYDHDQDFSTLEKSSSCISLLEMPTRDVIVNRRRSSVRWILIVLVAIADHGSAMPEPSSTRLDRGLPPQFDAALKSATAESQEAPRDLSKVRRLAALYQANRLYAEARRCYGIIAKAPEGLTARDHYLLADIARNENDLTTMTSELRATVDKEPGYLPARLALAEVEFKRGNEDAAEMVYAAIVRDDPSQPQSLLGLARIALQRDDDEMAVARLEELMAAHPGSTAGAALLAKVLERRGDQDRAIAMVQLSQQKPESPPDDPWLDALLADCYDPQRLSILFEEFFKLGKMKEATPVLDRLAELDPNGPITKMFAGFSHAKALEHVSAIREYYSALKAGGDPEKIAPLLVQSLLALGKVAEAAGLMTDMQSKFPSSLPIAKAQVEVALRQDDRQLARRLLEQVLQKEVYLRFENMTLARLLWEAGEKDDAVTCLKRVATAYKDDVASRALLGEYYLGKSDPISAIKPLEEANAQVSPNGAPKQGVEQLLAAAYLQAGTRAAEKEAWPEAAEYYEKLCQVAPEDLQAYAGWAAACVQLKQFDRAARALGKMAVLAPSNPTIHLSLGDVLYQDGREEPARRAWTKAKALVAPSDAELLTALRQRLNGPVSPRIFQ